MKVRGNINSETLTRREKEMINHLSHGLTSIEISELWFVSKTTVETHRKNIIRKINAKNTAHAVAHAIRAGWIN